MLLRTSLSLFQRVNTLRASALRTAPGLLCTPLVRMGFKSHKRVLEDLGLAPEDVIPLEDLDDAQVESHYAEKYRREQQSRRFRRKLKTKPTGVTFKDLKMASHVWSILHNLRVKDPSPIQEKLIPLLMKGSIKNKDYIIRAETGSGKTLTILMSILSKISRKTVGVQAIIVAPTRELTLQIYKTLNKLNEGGSADRKKNPVKIMRLAGESLHDQERIRIIQDPPHILIGTPKILAYTFANTSKSEQQKKQSPILLPHLKYVCMDEIDNLVEPFSLNHTSALLDLFKTGKMSKQNIQLTFVSATVTGKVKNIALKYMYEPTYVTPDSVKTLHSTENAKIGQKVELFAEDDLDFSLPPNLEHFVLPAYLNPITKENTDKDFTTKTHDKNKLRTLRRLYSAIKPRVMLVFFNGNTDSRFDFLVKEMTDKRKFRVAVLHNEATKQEKKNAVKLVETGRVHFVFVTEMGARGLDWKGATHVVNFDDPISDISYLHRAGRVGRLGGFIFPQVITFTDEPEPFRKMLDERLKVKVYDAMLDQGQFIVPDEQYTIDREMRKQARIKETKERQVKDS